MFETWTHRIASLRPLNMCTGDPIPEASFRRQTRRHYYPQIWNMQNLSNPLQDSKYSKSQKYNQSNRKLQVTEYNSILSTVVLLHYDQRDKISWYLIVNSMEVQNLPRYNQIYVVLIPVNTEDQHCEPFQPARE